MNKHRRAASPVVIHCYRVSPLKLVDRFLVDLWHFMRSPRWMP